MLDRRFPAVQPELQLEPCNYLQAEDDAFSFFFALIKYDHLS